jgi:serine/threonine protein kinase/WD40 repeat protein/class 3 adenylate cyclase
MFTDIEGSVSLQQMLGTQRYAQLITRHGTLFFEAITSARAGKVEKHTGDGFMARFAEPSGAVEVALRFLWSLRNEDWGIKRGLRVRVGIHQGEVLSLQHNQTLPDAIGSGVNIAARVMGMAEGSQVLMTKGVFDAARQSLTCIPGIPAENQIPLRWEAHGAYLIKGVDGTVDIFEVGEQAHGVFRPPKSRGDVVRSVSAEEEATLGWRPAAGMEVPKRKGWVLARLLGEGGFGEVWLAENQSTRDVRVFKFCFDALRLRSFKRELLLFRLIRESLGVRADIATLYEVQLEKPPFFLESEYCPGGGLKLWLEDRLRRGSVPLPLRIGIVARVARALAAAHSVGIIHKDVKPSNIFIQEDDDGHIRPRLADFGIGVLTDSSVIAEFGLSFTGEFSMGADASRTGTRLYSAPEYMVGKPPSVQGDIYSLGVVLYQMVIGNFDRPVGGGWQRDVEDPLLVEDISRCVDVEPQRRFASALELAERLETLEEAARQAQKQERELVAHRRRLRMALASTGIALVLLAAMVVAAVTLHRSNAAAIKHAADLAAERETAESRLYVSDMQTAIEDLVQRRGEAARELIKHHGPTPGKPDRRGWEWFFADSILNPTHIVRTVSRLPVRSLDISPDERQVAVAGDDGVISIWACDSLERTRTLSLAAGAVRCLAWENEAILAAGLATGEVVLWDVTADVETKRWRAHASAVTAMDWNPVDSILTTGGADGVTAWWNDAGKLVRHSQKQGPILALNWRSDGGEVAVVVGEPARLFVQKREEDSDEHDLVLNGDESSVAWRPGQHEVAVAMEGYPLCFFDPYTCGTSYTMPRNLSPGATAYVWSKPGDGIAVGGLDGKILVLDPKRHSEARSTPLYGHRGRVTALHWLSSPQGERLLSVGEDGTLRAWDSLRRSQELGNLPFDTSIADAEWSPVARKIAVLLASDELQIVDADTGQVEFSYPMSAPAQPRTPFTRAYLSWSPDGEWVAAACPGRPLAAWQLSARRRVLPAGADSPSDLSWTPDGKRMVFRTPSGCAWVAIDDLAAQARIIPGTEKAGYVIPLGSDRIGVIIQEERSLRLGMVNFEGTPLAKEVELPPLPGVVRVWALSWDRTHLAMGDDTGAVMWIDTSTGKSWRPNMTHGGPIKSIGWHPDGTRLVSVGGDGLSRIFNIQQTTQTWAARHELQPEVVAAGWSADGRTLAVASGPGKALATYDATVSLRREKGVPLPSLQRLNHIPQVTESGLRQACVWAQRNPEEEFGWKALVKELSRSASREDMAAQMITDAAQMAATGQFAPLIPQGKDATIVATWKDVPLPIVVQVAQACLLESWKEVVQLCLYIDERDSAAAWLSLAKAEALMRLGRRDEAEAANFKAWSMLLEHEAGRTSKVPSVTETNLPGATVSLSGWANIKPHEDWTFGENNNLLGMPRAIEQPEGFSFHTGDFIQLAGKGFRLSRSRMLPRLAGWIPFNNPGSDVWLLHAASYTQGNEYLQDTCIGSIFLLRQSGDRAVRIPLIYGRNVWDWWVPSAGQVGEPPRSSVAWTGQNPHATWKEKTLALYRTQWTANEGESPVIAAGIVTNMGLPAPMLLGIEVVR